MINKNLFYLFSLLAVLLISSVFVFSPNPVLASTTDGTIDDTNKYAWAENIGWISLNCSNDDSCSTVDYGVSNDGDGTLSGYAWGENTGWIDFDPTGGGVTVDSNGDFAGYAYGENIGWLVFNCQTTDSCNSVDYKVSTDWRPQSSRGATTVTSDQLDELYSLGYVTPVGNITNTSQVTYDREIIATLSASLGTAQVTTPSQTVVIKSGGGNFDFSQLALQDTTGAVSGVSGQSVLSSIKYGVSSIALSFNQSVTIQIPVSSAYNGSTLNVYKSESAGSGWSLLTTCTISSGICSFTTTSASYFAATRVAGGGGSSSSPPLAPTGGFKVSINEGANITNNRLVTLKFNAGLDTIKMALSRYSDFHDAGQEEYKASKVWDLCSGIDCPDGNYTVYAKFYTQSGQSSSSISSNIQYKKISSLEIKKQPLSGPETTPKPSKTLLTKNLGLGSRGKEVKLLQQVLNRLGFKITDSGPGAPGKETELFGAKTYKSIVKFQEVYRDKILKPLGLKRATGLVGTKTREIINQLLNQSK